MSNPSDPKLRLSTAGLCALTGVTRSALRLYEQEGLLPEPARSGSGYRQFGREAVQQVQAILQLKEVGFTLREIRWLLDERAAEGLDPERLRALAREQVAVIDQRVARLQVVRAYAQAVADGRTDLIDDPDCRFLLQFLQAGASPRAAAGD